MDKDWKLKLTGGVTGAVNGLFGGGGGMVLLPFLSRWGVLSGHALFANCVAIIFPVCAVSAAAYFLGAAVDLTVALPYLLGGFCGGLIGGRLFHAMPPRVLKLAFALFLLYAGVKYLL